MVQKIHTKGHKSFDDASHHVTNFNTQFLNMVTLLMSHPNVVGILTHRIPIRNSLPLPFTLSLLNFGTWHSCILAIHVDERFQENWDPNRWLMKPRHVEAWLSIKSNGLSASSETSKQETLYGLYMGCIWVVYGYIVLNNNKNQHILPNPVNLTPKMVSNRSTNLGRSCWHCRRYALYKICVQLLETGQWWIIQPSTRADDRTESWMLPWISWILFSNIIRSHHTTMWLTASDVGQRLPSDVPQLT